MPVNSLQYIPKSVKPLHLSLDFSKLLDIFIIDVILYGLASFYSLQ